MCGVCLRFCVGRVPVFLNAIRHVDLHPCSNFSLLDNFHHSVLHLCFTFVSIHPFSVHHDIPHPCVSFLICGSLSSGFLIRLRRAPPTLLLLLLLVALRVDVATRPCVVSDEHDSWCESPERNRFISSLRDHHALERLSNDFLHQLSTNEQVALCLQFSHSRPKHDVTVFWRLLSTLYLLSSPVTIVVPFQSSQFPPAAFCSNSTLSSRQSWSSNFSCSSGPCSAPYVSSPFDLS